MAECIIPDWYQRYSALAYDAVKAVGPEELARIHVQCGGFVALENSWLTVTGMPFADAILSQRGILPPSWVFSSQPSSSLMPHAVFADVLTEIRGDQSIMRVWSAVLTDNRLTGCLSHAVEGQRRMIPADGEFDASLKATFHAPDETPGLPYIDVRVSGSSSMSADSVIHWYKNGPWRKWQHRLWDGHPEIKGNRNASVGRLVRRWTLYALQHHAHLTQRESIRRWNDLAPEILHLKGGGRITGTGESVASQERREAEAFAKKLTLFLSGSSTLPIDDA